MSAERTPPSSPATRRGSLDRLRMPADESLERVVAELVRRLLTEESLIVGVTAAESTDSVAGHALGIARLLAAHVMEPVILVEADLRVTSRIAPAIYAHEVPGLVDVQTNPASLCANLQYTGFEHLWFLPSGVRDDNGGFVSASKFRAVMNQVRGSAPTCVLSLPPLDARGDGDLIANECDTLVLVVERDETTRARVADAVERVGTERFLGVVLTEPRPRSILGWRR